MVDALTKAWIRNEADARAAAAGMRFDIARAAWVVWWMGRYLRLYEGDLAGEPFVLRGAHSQPLFASQNPWAKGGYKETAQYIRDYMDCAAAGEPCDWQLEVHCRLYGWAYHSPDWNREIRRFNRCLVLIAKKNKKSPSIAANALYMAIGDGEPGQKVYLCAVTGDQAKDIAGKHAIEMVKSSPELLGQCKIDEGRARIHHLPSRSLIMPLHSGDVRSQRAREGLNGSGWVDEAHVVTPAYVNRISRMGISRREPIFGGFSTAGDDLTSWGFEQRSYGLKNNASGKDLHSLFVEYAAKQAATDAEIAAHLDDYIRAANPALGHTVRIEEARQDYLNSQANDEQRAVYNKYRLNIWARAKNVWIRPDEWNRGRAKRWKKPSAETPAWAAVYLGYVDEPSAMTLVFPADPARIDQAMETARGEDGAIKPARLPLLIRALDQKIRSQTWYWLPDGAIAAHGHAFPYREWQESRAAKITNGPALDPDRIAREICAILKTCDVQALAYDAATAGVLIGSICEAGHYPIDRCLPFPRQTHGRWSFAMAQFERLLRAGQLAHRQNDALDWEIGHAQAAPDRLGGTYLIEPERGDRKTVAGPASILMALDALARAERFYRSELIFF
jgi:phage terminase large subunit-like protein